MPGNDLNRSCFDIKRGEHIRAVASAVEAAAGFLSGVVPGYPGALAILITTDL